MKPDYKMIGKRIKKARENKKITQAVLSEKMGVSPEYISKVENGASHFNIGRLFQVGELLDVSEVYLLSGVKETSPHYLEKEMADILKNCTPKEKKLIYETVKTIIKNMEKKEKN